MVGKDVEGDFADIKGQKMVIKGDTITLKHECKFKIDAAKHPKEQELEGADGGDAEKGTWKGIYELKGDDLTLCMALPNLDRPQSFETKEGVLIMLLKLKRVK